jgi:hypothetical protein
MLPEYQTFQDKMEYVEVNQEDPTYSNACIRI